MLKSEAKKRKDSAESYHQAQREDLAQTEEKEIGIIQKYLPEQLSDDQIREEIKNIISENNFTASDFGKAMGIVMKHFAGKADGQEVSRILKEEISKN